MNYEASQIKAMRAYYSQAGVIEFEEDEDTEDNIVGIGEAEFA